MRLAVSLPAALAFLVLAVPGCAQRSARTAALPDWSGVWALVDRSFWLANVDAYSGDVPLTPAYQTIRAQARKELRQANMTSCLPAGATAVLQHGMLFEVLFTPGRVTLLFEDGETRRIWTDGRPHRPLSELRNSYMGDSIGHWEGQTLVVDTVGFPKGELWQNHGVRATLHTHLIERLFLNPAGQLQIDSVMTDPAIFARPYAFTRLNVRQKLPLYESACAQNNRDDGTHIDLTPPEE